MPDRAKNSADETPVRILHLSDFHVSPDRKWDQTPVLVGLTKAIGEFVDAGLVPDVVP